MRTNWPLVYLGVIRAGLAGTRMRTSGILERMAPHVLLSAVLVAVLAVGCRETPAAERAAASARARATPRPVFLGNETLDTVYARAGELPRLRSLIVFHRDTLRRERYFRGARAEQPANIKSA